MNYILYCIIFEINYIICIENCEFKFCNKDYSYNYTELLEIIIIDNITKLGKGHNMYHKLGVIHFYLLIYVN